MFKNITYIYLSCILSLGSLSSQEFPIIKNANFVMKKIKFFDKELALINNRFGKVENMTYNQQQNLINTVDEYLLFDLFSIIQSKNSNLFFLDLKQLTEELNYHRTVLENELNDINASFFSWGRGQLKTEIEKALPQLNACLMKL